MTETDEELRARGFPCAPTRDAQGRDVPWTAFEPVASRVARCVPGYRLREGDAWALAWYHVAAIVPDATVGEVSRYIGLVGDPRWLETTVYAILTDRGQDPTAAVKKAQALNVYEGAREGEGGSDG